MDEEIKPEIKRHIEIKLEEHMEAEDARFNQLITDIKELKTELKLFTDAWQQAKGMVTFIKWFIGFSSGIAALFLFFKEHWK